MNLVIHAPNVHQGGGRTLLLALLQAARDIPCTIILDSRLELPPTLPSSLAIMRVLPTPVSRLVAEWRLSNMTKGGDVVLCFGNLPPMWRTAANVKVFLQNRYLVARRDLDSLDWRTRLRIVLERFWLRTFLRRAQLIVQTESMRLEVQAALGVEASVIPFSSPCNQKWSGQFPRQFDFIYVASGEPHKNHQNLVAAWSILAKDELRPSLCLTLDPGRERSLLEWIDERVQRDHLNIQNIGALPRTGVSLLYGNVNALIYPSLFESFGLPLIEAEEAGLPMVASERDYVRDVVTPAQTFDPTSPLSIARAVKRFQGETEARPAVLSPEEFLRRVM